MIEVENLGKAYGAFKAVDDVSFSVGAGQVLGFLGPNGAGKTTIMKILTGFHFPSAGEARVDGFSVREEPVEVKKRIGYLPEGVPLYGELTVGEYLRFIADIRLVPARERRQKIGAALDACGLGAKRNARVETLSKGYKQRVGLAQAILADPRILILDEPTTGLDPNQIIEIRALISELGRSKTVILSTHILQEVEAVCSNVLILNEGRIAAAGAPESIASEMRGGERWELTLKGADAGTVALRGRLEALGAEAFGGALEIKELRESGGGRAEAAFFIKGARADDDEAACRVFDWAVSGGFKILRMERSALSLEDIFVKLTKADGAPKAPRGEGEGGV